MVQLVQDPKEFLDEFISYIYKAKESIYIHSMIVESGDVMDSIETALLDAARRGVKVYFNYDWVSQKFAHGYLPFFPTLNKTKRMYGSTLHKKNAEMMSRLLGADITLHKTNVPSLLFAAFPHMGRNHIKMYIVDHKIAWVGGVGLFDNAFENIDIMIKILNKKVVEALVHHFFTVSKGYKFFDYKKQCDAYSIYFDAGKKGKSIIYKRAVQLIEESEKSILFMSQYVPDGQILKQLIDVSKRGIKVIIITCPVSNDQNDVLQKFTFPIFKKRIKRYGNIKLIHLPKYVHAKLLLIDGKIAFWGSHNLTYAGVLLGTSEVMIETKDAEIVKQVQRFVARYSIDLDRK